MKDALKEAGENILLCFGVGIIPVTGMFLVQRAWFIWGLFFLWVGLMVVPIGYSIIKSLVKVGKSVSEVDGEARRRNVELTERNRRMLSPMELLRVRNEHWDEVMGKAGVKVEEVVEAMPRPVRRSGMGRSRFFQRHLE